jgi:hypothetical protein
MPQVREVFAKQIQQGKGPQLGAVAPAFADA